MKKEKLIQIQCSIPSKKVAKKIAKHLVQEQLTACVNILPKINSYYIYEGEYCEDEELLLLIKTDAKHFKTIEKVILSLHPYSLPEIIALPITKVNAEYQKWMQTALSTSLK